MCTQLNILRATKQTKVAHLYDLFQARNFIFQMLQWRHCAAWIGISRLSVKICDTESALDIIQNSNL